MVSFNLNGEKEKGERERNELIKIYFDRYLIDR